MPDPRKPSVAAPAGSDESGTFPEQDALFNNLVARTLTVVGSALYTPSTYGGGQTQGEIWAPRPNGLDDTTALTNWIASLISAGPGIVGRLWPTKGSTPYIQSGPLSVSGAGGLTIRGCGKQATILKRANSTNAVQLDILNSPNITITEMGFDANGLNQASQPHSVAFSDALSHNATVEAIQVNNSGGFAIWSQFTSNLARPNNLRVLRNDISAATGTGVDLISVTSQGGAVALNRVVFQTGLGINIYESNDLPVLGNVLVGTGNAGTGLNHSSSLASPVGLNTFLLGANDTGIQIFKEVDNAFAREMLQALFGFNTFRGDQATSLIFRLIGAINVQLLGNEVYGANRFILYQSGVNDQIEASHNQLQNVNTFEVRSVTPTNVRYKDNGGINPPGVNLAPAFPATATDVVNNTGYDCTAYIANGTSAITALTEGHLNTPVNDTHVALGTGGTLLASTTYFYRVSALNAGGETLASTETSIATPAGANTCSVVVKVTPISGALYYNFYGRTTGAELRIGTHIRAPRFVDDGSVTPSGALPGGNTTGVATGFQIPASGFAAIPMKANSVKTPTYAGGAPTWTWLPD